jgi:hypothetical protein
MTNVRNFVVELGQMLNQSVQNSVILSYVFIFVNYIVFNLLLNNVRKVGELVTSITLLLLGISCKLSSDKGIM